MQLIITYISIIIINDLYIYYFTHIYIRHIDYFTYIYIKHISIILILFYI